MEGGNESKEEEEEEMVKLWLTVKRLLHTPHPAVSRGAFSRGIRRRVKTSLTIWRVRLVWDRPASKRPGRRYAYQRRVLTQLAVLRSGGGGLIEAPRYCPDE